MNVVYRMTIGMTCLALLGCDGVRGASDYSKRVSYEASFEQIPLIEERVSEDRTLKMYVFTGRTGDGTRSGYNVNFAASVSR